MARELLVVGRKTFKITIPDEAKVTFGPWSPKAGEDRYTNDKAMNGTLRVYATTRANSTILAVFSGVTEFRDSGVEYSEMVAREEGAVIWKSDKDGYHREEKVSRAEDWTTPLVSAGDESSDVEEEGAF